MSQTESLAVTNISVLKKKKKRKKNEAHILTHTEAKVRNFLFFTNLSMMRS